MADAELSAVLANAFVHGNYVAHYANLSPKGEKQIFVLTSFQVRTSKPPTADDNPWEVSWHSTWQTNYLLTRVTVTGIDDKATIETKQAREWPAGDRPKDYSITQWGAHAIRSLTPIADNRLVAATGQGFMVFTMDDSLRGTTVSINGIPEGANATVIRLDSSASGFGLTFSHDIKIAGESDQDRTVTYSRRFLAMPTVSADGAVWTVGSAINVPGSPLAFISPSGAEPYLITSEQIMLDPGSVEPTRANNSADPIVSQSANAVTAPYLQSFSIKGGIAKLKDIVSSHGLDPDSLIPLDVNGPLLSLTQGDGAVGRRRGPIFGFGGGGISGVSLIPTAGLAAQRSLDGRGGNAPNWRPEYPRPYADGSSALGCHHSRQ